MDVIELDINYWHQIIWTKRNGSGLHLEQRVLQSRKVEKGDSNNSVLYVGCVVSSFLVCGSNPMWLLTIFQMMIILGVIIGIIVIIIVGE